MEWDTAAGHAVLIAAGGRMENFNGENFQYAKPNFRNNWFIAYGK
jgi:3'(2'), 5'-bisphosphate nucleotidase